MGKIHQIGSFVINDIIIKIAGNEQEWGRSVLSYLSMPASSNTESGQKVISLDLYLCSDNEIDRVLPLPGEKYFHLEKTLLVDRPVQNRSYRIDGQHWINYEGFGRFMLDYGKNRAVAAFLINSGISQVYADIALGYNPLLGLLAGHGYNAIHASCARVGGKGVLFTGYGGSGKSTSAYAMLRSGHPVLADDRILLKENNPVEVGQDRIAPNSYSAYSISDVMKLKQEAIDNFFPEAREIDYLHQVDDEYYFKATAYDGGSYLNSTKIDYLMVFEKTGRPESRLEKINPSRVVGDLFPVTMSNYEAAAMEKKFSFLANFLESVECFKIYFGTDMKQFVGVVKKLVQEG